MKPDPHIHGAAERQRADSRNRQALRQARTTAEILQECSHRFADRVAIVDGDKRLSFRQLQAGIDDVARSLVSRGVEQGDRVALWITNNAEYVQCLLGAMSIGAIAVPLNTRYRRQDLAYALKHCGAKVLIYLCRSGPVDFDELTCDVLGGDQGGYGGALHHDFPELETVVAIGRSRDERFEDWTEFLHEGGATSRETLLKQQSVDANDPALIVYTSGTTGNPKAVLHSHVSLSGIADRASRLRIKCDDVILNYLPLFHLYGLSEALVMSVVTGAKMVTFPVFEPGEALDAVQTEQVSILHGFDTHYRELVSAQKARQRDVSSLRLATFPAGSEETATVAEEVENTLCKTISGYGMSEIWAFASLSFMHSSLEQRTGASGYPMPDVSFRCVNPDTGNICEPGEPGELQVSGYNVMLGYFRDEQSTGAAFTHDGWFRTGDLGLIRPDGHFRFMGRHRDVLKIGGENVSPLEVEAFLLKHEAIVEAAVVGVPDQRLGEVPVAFVRVRDACEASEESLIAFCRGKIASFKIPRHVLFVDGLPATPTGKVKKNILREEAVNQLEIKEKQS